MNIPYPDNIDYVYIANTLHHVDFDKCTNEIYRVLKPGGKNVVIGSLKHNPIINIYRRMATKVRTEDESPLNINVVDKLKNFSSVQYDTFWFCNFWIFIRFYLIEKVHPNDEPYWKVFLMKNG
ncbi:MAG: methyltransferase domain-containing protein [Bacteroidetes bacterium]|nr:methyltransferase domain-containing protein [Bacteroidota bacterium]